MDPREHDDDDAAVWAAWQARKQASWDADQRALASGEKTREQLMHENSGVTENVAKAISWDKLLWL